MGKGPLLAALVILALCVVATHWRNVIWGDSFRLWQDTAAKSPGKARPLYNLGVEYAKRGQPREAMRLLGTVATMKGDPEIIAQAKVGLAYLWIDSGHFAEAFAILQPMIETRQDALNAMALLYLRSGQPERALEITDTMLRLQEDWQTDPLFHVLRGQAWERLGNCERAREEYAVAHRLAPKLAIPSC